MSEFQHLIPIEHLPESGVPFRIVASAEVCRALAQRFELLALGSLRAEGLLAPHGPKDLYRLEGSLHASVVQRCVVTLEPVPAEVESRFERLFQVGLEEASHEIVVDAEIDEPEPLVGGRVDVGEIVAEELALALDPYPHAPGAEASLAELTGESGEAGPFAQLAVLKARLQ